LSERYPRASAVKDLLPVEVHDEHDATYEAALARSADMTFALLTVRIHRA